MAESKVCVGCGELYYRRDGQKPSQWAAQRYCSRRCAVGIYNRNKIPSPEQMREIIRSRVTIDPATECWEYTLQINANGYAVIKWGGRSEHGQRMSYRAFMGEFDPALRVCHSCDNPKCLNPDHLFLGTTKDNVDDKVAKGRHPVGEASGMAKLTEADVVAIRSYKESIKGLMRRLCVSQTTITDVRARKRWCHVP